MSEPSMTEAELSRGSGAALELLRRLVDLGIVPRRDGEHPFVPGDIHRVRLAQAFERSGIPLETLTRLYAMWGLPRPAPEDVVREDDAPTFSDRLAPSLSKAAARSSARATDPVSAWEAAAGSALATQ